MTQRELRTRLQSWNHLQIWSGGALTMDPGENEGRSNGLDRAEAMLSAVAFFAKAFAREASWQDAAADALARLGEAAEVSRVYVYENSSSDGELRMSLWYEWCVPGIESTVGTLEHQNFPYSSGYRRWQELLARGEVIHGAARNFPASERTGLAREDVLSIAAVPVFCDGRWWGFIGFDDCRTERGWSAVEIDTLRAAAEIFAGAIERRRSAEKLEKSHLLVQALVEQLPAALYIEDYSHGETVSEYISPQVEAMIGITPEEWLSKEGNDIWFDRVHPDDRERVTAEWVQRGQSGRELSDFRMNHRDGRMVWIRECSRMIFDNENKPMMEVGLLLDISELKEAEQQISFLAYHDSLTGLANRALFEEMLEPAIARAKRENLSVAVLYMDLDGFKAINDNFGHAAGDEFLKQVAERIKITTRDTDLVARQGGDEFLVLLPDLPLGPDPEDLTGGDRAVGVAELRAERIRELMREPFAIGENEIEFSVSVGISVFPVDAADSCDLIKNADLAMYESKKRRPGSYAIHAETSADPLLQHAFVHRLRGAVKGKHWVLHYQPVVELESGTMVGVEALLRWRQVHGTLISPAEFLPLAEEMGLLEIIGEWVLEELCRQSELWRSEGLDLNLSFNLSPRQLWHIDLADSLASHLSGAKIDPTRFIVEISESTVMVDPARAQKILWRLRDRGIKIAIDDFGTGYSPPARLKQLPVDYLKIDQPLIRDVVDDTRVRSFVRAVIEFANDLGIVPHAEGVERREERQFLIENRCKLAQGHLFSRPVPPEMISRLAKLGRGLDD